MAIFDSLSICPVKVDGESTDLPCYFIPHLLLNLRRNRLCQLCTDFISYLCFQLITDVFLEFFEFFFLPFLVILDFMADVLDLVR
jgi:hypothetical protein